MSPSRRLPYAARWCSAALAVFAAHAVQAQPQPRYTLNVQQIPLAEALRQAAALTGVALSYDPALVAGRTSTCRVATSNAEAVLSCALGDAPLVVVRTGAQAYTLRPRPVAVASPVVPPPVRTASVLGVVTDRETGRGLPDVVLTTSSYGTTTSLGGQFLFTGLSPGTYRLQATHVGYEPTYATVELEPGGKRTLRLALKPRTVELPQTVVEGLSTVRRYERLGIDETRETPPLPERAASPGWPVTPAEALANYRLQGTPEGDYFLTLDGAPLFAPPSLLGEIGPLGSLAIGRVTVHKTGAGASSASSLSGTVEATHVLGTQSDLTAQLTPLALDVRASGPFSLRGQARGMMAIRTGLPDVMGLNRVTAATEQRVHPDPIFRALLGPTASDDVPMWGPAQVLTSFTDFHAAYQQNGRGLSHLSASGYYGQRRVASDYPAPRSASTDYDTRVWDTYSAQAQWLTGLSGTTLALLRASAGGARQRHAFGIASSQNALFRSYEEANDIFQTSLEGRLDVALTQGIRAESGVYAAYTHASLSSVTLQGRTATTTVAQPRAKVFAALRLSPIPQVQAELGARVAYLPTHGEAFVDPHLTLRADGEMPLLGPWAVRLAAGQYHQFLVSTLTPDLSPASAFGTTRTWVVPDTSTITPAADQYAAEARFDPAPWLGIQLDAYFREQLRALTYTPPLVNEGALSLSSFTANTPLRASGVGATVEINRPLVTAQFRYAYHREKRAWPFIPSDIGTPPLSQPQTASAAVAVRPSPRWEVSATLRAATHDRWAYRLGYYAAAQALRNDALDPARAAELTPIIAAAGLDTPDATLPPSVRLDLGVAYQRQVGPAHLIARLNVLNALDRANPDEQVLVPTPSGLSTVPQGTLPLTLGASLRLTLRGPEPPEQ